MPIKTIGPKIESQPLNDNFQDIETRKTEKTTTDGHNTRIGTLEAEQESGKIQTKTIPHGLSTIETDQKTPLDIAMDGRSLINHMGWQGKFASLFNRWGANLAIDTSVYKFGTSSGKINNSAGTSLKVSESNQKMYLSGKRFLIGLWAKAVSGSPNAQFKISKYDNTGSFIASNNNNFTPTTDWKFYWFKVDYSADSSDHYKSGLAVLSYGTADDVVNFDGMITMPLTQAQYDEIDILSNDEVAEKYGYVDSVKHIQNPVFVSYGKNLNGVFTEWNNLASQSTIVAPYQLDVVADGTTITNYNQIDCLSNQEYTLSGSISVNDSAVYYDVIVYDKNGTQILDSGNVTSSPVTFTTPSNASYMRLRTIVTSAKTSGTFTFTNPQLELGSNATTFEIQNKTYLYGKDVKLGSNLDGSVADQLLDRNSMLKRFELDMVLDGSLGWAFSADYTGFKRVRLETLLNNPETEIPHYLVKYDGKITKKTTSWSNADEYVISSSDSKLYISIADTDSGWTDAMTGTTITANFIKGYFNGWKYTGDGTTHSWVQINDATVTSTSDTFVADPANSHVDWTPYELSYELADSVVEPVTMEGALNLIEGLNQVERTEGVIVRELANPVNNNAGFYHINRPDIASSSQLDYRTLEILEVNRGVDKDTKWVPYEATSAYGKQAVYIPEADFDDTKSYYVTYTVKDKHLFTANGLSAEGTYNTNLKTVVDKHTDQIADLNTKQSIQDIWNDDVAVKGEGEVVQKRQVTVSVSASTSGSKSIVFERAYSKKPIIVATTNASKSWNVSVRDKTTTSFTVEVQEVHNNSITDDIEVEWIAIG
jgi:hypothetical protein